MDFIETIRPTIPLAMRDILTAEVDYIMMGLLAETFWGGLEGNAEFVAYLREVMRPDMGLTTGVNAEQAALSKFEVKNISVVSPYQPIDDEQVLTNNYVAEIDHHTGHKIRTSGPILQFGSGMPELKSSPSLGQHTDQVLSDIGFSSEQITELRDGGSVN